MPYSPSALGAAEANAHVHQSSDKDGRENMGTERILTAPAALVERRDEAIGVAHLLQHLLLIGSHRE